MSCATIGIGPLLRARGKVISPGNACDATLPRLDFRQQPQPLSCPTASYFLFIISHRPKMDGFELNAVSGWLRLHGCRPTLAISFLRRDWQPLDHHLIPPNFLRYILRTGFLSNLTLSFPHKKHSLLSDWIRHLLGFVIERRHEVA
jgi:hypothetical protein